MSSQPPLDLKNDRSPPAGARNQFDRKKEDVEKEFEIKNPLLPNLFHYGMIALLLGALLLLFGGIFFFRSGGSLTSEIVGGVFIVFCIVSRIRSPKYLDDDHRGF